MTDEEVKMRPKDAEKYGGWCHTGSMAHIIINNARELTLEQLRGVLLRIRNAIIAGKRLIADDSTDIGNKYTNCTWGMCSSVKAYYNSNKLQHFPKDFDDHNRVSQLPWPTGHGCPMDMERKTSHHYGCFYRCRVFQHKFTTPTKNGAVALYDEAIKEVDDALKTQ